MTRRLLRRLRNTSLCFVCELRSSLEKSSKKEQQTLLLFLVGVTRLELATSCPPDKRATNCATPRSLDIIETKRSYLPNTMAILPQLFFFCNKNNAFIGHNLKIMLKYFRRLLESVRYENEKKKTPCRKGRKSQRYIDGFRFRRTQLRYCGTLRRRKSRLAKIGVFRAKIGQNQHIFLNGKTKATYFLLVKGVKA